MEGELTASGWATPASACIRPGAGTTRWRVDVRLYLRKECDGLRGRCCGSWCGVLCDKAGEYSDIVMPGYTHLQRAQPITFGHHLMAYAEMFLRDIGRLQDAKKRMDDHASWLRGAGGYHVSAWTGNCTAELVGVCRAVAATAWTAFPTGISVWSWRRRVSHCHGAPVPFFRGNDPVVLLGI